MTDVLIETEEPILLNQAIELNSEVKTETRVEKQKSTLSNMDKLEMLLVENDQILSQLKTTYEKYKMQQTILRKLLKKLNSKVSRSNSKVKEPRKPCGFARPTLVSDEMCVFLKKEPGSLVSRTDVTKSLIEYIDKNKLQRVNDKRYIIPDETLYKLFGEASRSIELTYFTMQKYVNHHFPSAKSVPVA